MTTGHPTHSAIRLGTRGSELARWQTARVEEALRQAAPQAEIETIVLKTTGDRLSEAALRQIGGKGAFTAEIEAALLEHRADIAVHSLKDLPTAMPDGLAIGAISLRADPRDLLLAKEPLDLRSSARILRIGTSSPRRQAQLRRLSDRIECVDVRGNVPTRLRKLLEGELDGLVLAAAGIRRLGLSAPFERPMEPDEMLPAPGQGAIACEVRSASTDEDIALRALLRSAFHHQATAACTTAERSLLAALEGGCSVPLGALGVIGENGRLVLRGRVLAPDASRVAEDEVEGAPEEAAELGLALAERLVRQGARLLLTLRNPAGQGPLYLRRVIVTGDEGHDGPLSQALRNLAADPIPAPLVRARPPRDATPLKAAAARLSHYQWLVFTSARGVTALAEHLPHGALARFEGRIACVGAATARAAERAGARVSVVPPEQADAEGLLAAFDTHELRRAAVLYPRAEGARPTLADGLRARGAVLDDPVAYRMEAEADTSPLRSALEQKPDAILFCSASAAESLPEEAVPQVSKLAIGSMGPTTSAALRARGLEPAFEPQERTFEGMALALAIFLEGGYAR